MSDANQQRSTAQQGKPEWKLEVVQIPVSDVDRAKRFYAEQVGFTVDLDTPISDTKRLVQLTPPGSGCFDPPQQRSLRHAAGIGARRPDRRAGHRSSQGELLGRGVEVSSVRHMDGGVWVDGPGGPWNLFVFFDDPDGNGWVLQERPS
jgi:catechol 2,3-dioxygenase-like lactoylglutathione lyase family enzyme